VAVARCGDRNIENGKGDEEMKKEQMVGTRLPEELVRDLELIENAEQADRSTTVRKLLYKAVGDWKLEHYAKLYGEGKLTLARAAREAGVSLWEMMDYARKKKIPAQYDVEDFEADVKRIGARLASR
jgi:predicted HTH domain antitoxin